MIMDWELSDEKAVKINKHNIIPSRHKRVDMRWDRNIKVPRRENVKARMMLVVEEITLAIMG